MDNDEYSRTFMDAINFLLLAVGLIDVKKDKNGDVSPAELSAMREKLEGVSSELVFPRAMLRAFLLIVETTCQRSHADVFNCVHNVFKNKKMRSNAQGLLNRQDPFWVSAVQSCFCILKLQTGRDNVQLTETDLNYCRLLEKITSFEDLQQCALVAWKQRDATVPMSARRMQELREHLEGSTNFDR